MAKIRTGGSALGSLNERQETFGQVLSEVGFRQLTTAEEKFVRGTLSLAIGQWMMTEGTGSTAGLTVKSVTMSLQKLARDLENAARMLPAASTGMHRSDDIEVAMRLADALGHLTTFKSKAE